MSVQVVPSLCDTPWRAEEACRTHQAYPTRRMAERIAELHPLRVLACPKCNDGRKIEPFECTGSKPPHYHVGHGRSWEGEEDPMASATTVVPIRAGDTWVAVSAKGRGQPVRIRTVTALNVQFRATGRGADDSKTFSLPLDLFRVRYAPQRSADDRRRELALAARRNEPTKADGREIARQAVEVVDAIEVELTPEPTTEPQMPPEPAVRRRHGGVPKLNAEKAREIAVLIVQGVPDKEIAAAYGDLHPSTISSIRHGKIWAAATADIRNPQLAPDPTPAQEEPVQIATPPTMFVNPSESTAPNVPTLKIGGPIPTLTTDLADALEMLLDIQAGKPLPRFVTLDLGAIRDLVAQARS